MIGEPGKTSRVTTESQIAGDVNTDMIRMQKEMERQERTQLEIDRYNDAVLKGCWDPRLDKMQFMNQSMVVRLLKSDYLRQDLDNDDTSIDRAITERVKVRQKIVVDAPVNGGRGLWVDNPLPYRFAGVICAIDENALRAKNVDTGDLIWDKLTPGTFVQLGQFNLKDARYYVNDDDFDPINEVDPDDMPTFPNFEGYAMLTPGAVRAIVSAEQLRTGPSFDDIVRK